MGFSYGQFGVGFELIRPSWLALNFASNLKRVGEEVTVISRSSTGKDPYGNPITSESSHLTRGFVVNNLDQAKTPAGDMPRGRQKLYLPRWSAVRVGDDVEFRGSRFRVSSQSKTRAYLEVETERRSDA